MSRNALLLALWLVRLQLTNAQTTNATCAAGYDWMQNSRGQNPCLMAAYAQGACEPDGEWQVRDIPPGENLTYSGPSSEIQLSQCSCSSVAYSLISACATCQNELAPYWGNWTEFCSADLVSNGRFPHTIPAGTAFPAWAFLQVSGNRWNAVDAQTIASSGYPESSAIGQQSTVSAAPSGSSSSAAGAGLTSAASQTSSSSSGTPTAGADTTTSSKKSNTNAIIGGAVGGGIGGIILGVLAFWLIRYKPWRPKTSPFPSNNFAERESMVTSSSPVYSTTATAVPPHSPMMKLYNPDDPSTFPSTPPPLVANHGYPMGSTDNFPHARPFSQG